MNMRLTPFLWTTLAFFTGTFYWGQYSTTLTPSNAHSRVTNGKRSSDDAYSWRCCAGESPTVNVKVLNRSFFGRSSLKFYCPDKVGNLSYYYAREDDDNVVLDASRWQGHKILIIGGSTSRQMVEQLIWELGVEPLYTYNSRFFFNLLTRKIPCCTHTFAHEIDLCELDTDIMEVFRKSNNSEMEPLTDIVMNLATWYNGAAVGYVRDCRGTRWKLTNERLDNWEIEGFIASNGTVIKPSSEMLVPKLDFSSFVEQAMQLMERHKPKTAKVVWRSESKSDCPPGRSHRSIVKPMLERNNISILNISQLTCSYASVNFEEFKLHGVHMNFPSPVLRQWLVMYQRQYLAEHHHNTSEAA